MLLSLAHQKLPPLSPEAAPTSVTKAALLPKVVVELIQRCRLSSSPRSSCCCASFLGHAVTEEVGFTGGHRLPTSASSEMSISMEAVQRLRLCGEEVPGAEQQRGTATTRW